MGESHRRSEFFALSFVPEITENTIVRKELEELEDEKLDSLFASLKKSNGDSLPFSILNFKWEGLTCATHLLLRKLIANPFVDSLVLEQIFVDYLELAKDPDSSINPGIKKIVDDLYNQIYHCNNANRLVGAYQKLIEPLSMIKMEGNSIFHPIDVTFPHLSSSLIRLSLGKQIRKRFDPLISNETKRETAEKMWKEYANYEECIETLAFALLVPHLDPEMKRFSSNDSFYLEKFASFVFSKDRWVKVHPWLLTEIAFHHNSFASSLLNCVVESYSSLDGYVVKTILSHLLNRGTELKQKCLLKLGETKSKDWFISTVINLQ